jgi:SET and MYND domain-containing protein
MGSFPIQHAHSKQFQRHLLAARDVSLGERVWSQEPYAAVLYDDQVALRCDYCFAQSEHLMRCSRSRFAHYCCQTHQKAAWKAYYRQECEALVACAPRIPPASVRLAARVLWRRAGCVLCRLQQQLPSIMLLSLLKKVVVVFCQLDALTVLLLFS